MSELLSETQAQEALFSAMQTDGLAPTSYGTEGEGSSPGNTDAEQALAAQREASQTAAQGTPQVEQTETQTPSQAEQVEAFTRLDPNTIPEELKPWYQSMQADYTRKTQAIAEQRKQYENFNVDEASQAVQFYNSLRDPQFAKTFYGQLGDTLTNLGYLEQQQQQELAQVAVQAQQQNYQDPEEYFAAKAAELDTKYANLEQRFQEQQQAAEQARVYSALAGEVQRQESVLRDANPHYTDTDIDAVYAMAGNTTNLLEAADRYEAAVSDRLNRMMAAKTGVAHTVGLPAPTGSATEPPNFGDNLDLAHKAAQERLQQILAAENQ